MLIKIKHQYNNMVRPNREKEVMDHIGLVLPKGLKEKCEARRISLGYINLSEYMRALIIEDFRNDKAV